MTKKTESIKETKKKITKITKTTKKKADKKEFTRTEVDTLIKTFDMLVDTLEHAFDYKERLLYKAIDTYHRTILTIYLIIFFILSLTRLLEVISGSAYCIGCLVLMVQQIGFALAEHIIRHRMAKKTFRIYR